MGETATVEQRGGPLRRWLAGLSLSRLWQLGVVGVLAATALFGGLATVDTNVTVAEVGTPFSDGEFTLTVERASTVTEISGGSRVVLPAKPGKRYLGVVATVRNDGTIPGQLQNELQLQGVPGAEWQVARRTSDSEPVAGIGAGLTEELVFLWTLPDDAIQPGESITLRIPKKRFRELITLYGRSWVASPTDYLQIEVPVKVRP